MIQKQGYDFRSCFGSPIPERSTVGTRIGNLGPSNRKPDSSKGFFSKGMYFKTSIWRTNIPFPLSFQPRFSKIKNLPSHYKSSRNDQQASFPQR